MIQKDSLLRAAASAAAATVPAFLGACLGDASDGLTASFGTYLVAVTHNALPSQNQASRLLITY
jgi:hypothetical protein